MSIDRRRFLQRGAALSLLSLHSPLNAAAAESGVRFRRVRPSDADWPSTSRWQALSQNVGRRLIRVSSPLSECIQSPGDTKCAELFRALKNPYYIGDEPGLTQTLGWVDAGPARRACMPSSRATRPMSSRLSTSPAGIAFGSS